MTESPPDAAELLPLAGCWLLAVVVLLGGHAGVLGETTAMLSARGLLALGVLATAVVSVAAGPSGGPTVSNRSETEGESRR